MANHNRGSRSSAAPGFAAAMRCLLPLLLLLAVGHSRDTEGEDPRGMTVKELVLSRTPSCRDQACLCRLPILPSGIVLRRPQARVFFRNMVLATVLPNHLESIDLFSREPDPSAAFFQAV